jgi:hypothetical protein
MVQGLPLYRRRGVGVRGEKWSRLLRGNVRDCLTFMEYLERGSRIEVSEALSCSLQWSVYNCLTFMECLEGGSRVEVSEARCLL